MEETLDKVVRRSDLQHSDISIDTRDSANWDGLARIILNDPRYSYSGLVKKIEEEKYRTWWSRTWHPKLDKRFDENVRVLVSSINTVASSNISPELFTTKGRRSELNMYDILAIMGATGIAIITYPAYAHPETLRGLPNYLQALIKAVPVLIFPVSYSVSKIPHNGRMKSYLRDLYRAAQKADEALNSQRP